MLSSLIQVIFWAIITVTAVLLLIMTISNFVEQIKLDKEFDKINQKQKEILNKMLEIKEDK